MRGAIDAVDKADTRTLDGTASAFDYLIIWAVGWPLMFLIVWAEFGWWYWHATNPAVRMSFLYWMKSVPAWARQAWDTREPLPSALFPDMFRNLG